MVLFVFRDLHLPRYQWLFLVYYILTYISYIERDNLLYYGIVLYCIQQLMCIRQKRTENTNIFTVAFRDRETTIFDPVRVFLSTHRWSQKTACQHCFYKPSRKCHPSQWVSTTPLETVTPRASEELKLKKGQHLIPSKEVRIRFPLRKSPVDLLWIKSSRSMW